MNARRFYILYVLAAAAIIGLIMMLTSLWVPAKAALAQYLLEESWEHYQLTGDKRRPWPWADHYAQQSGGLAPPADFRSATSTMNPRPQRYFASSTVSATRLQAIMPGILPTD